MTPETPNPSRCILTLHNNSKFAATLARAWSRGRWGRKPDWPQLPTRFSNTGLGRRGPALYPHTACSLLESVFARSRMMVQHH